MAEDLESNLSNYRLQLQQVEAALTSDPQNEDLQKLKKDLQEVTELTLELIKNQSNAQHSASPYASSGDPQEEQPQAARGATAYTSLWKVGDDCLALYSADQTYYEAVIDEIQEDGSCTVTFSGYDNTDVTQVATLKPLEEAVKAGSAEDDSTQRPIPKTKRDKMAAEREYKRKKSQKKAQRLKQLDEDSEQDKNKWINFNSKIFSKTTKGRVKKSIFASPESTSGKVGVGTCGVSGRPMTTFTQHEKWKK